MKIHKNLKTLLHKYNKCLTESEQKFLNGNLSKLVIFMACLKFIEAVIHSQNTGVVEVQKPSNLKLEI